MARITSTLNTDLQQAGPLTSAALAQAMRARARVEGPSGQQVALEPGDLIGRTHRSALRLDDPRVSEAHALVSLRGGALKLLSLRGLLVVERRAVPSVELCAGLTVHLAKGAALHVLEVTLPASVLAVAVGEQAPVALTGSVQSIVGQPARLKAGFHEGALAHVWSTGDGWLWRPRDADASPVDAGTTVDLDGTSVRFLEVGLHRVGAPSTIDAGRLHPALHLVARYHSVHVHRVGRPVVSLSGQPAMLLSELVSLDGPVDWEVLAKLVWRRLSRRDALRKKLDAALLRLRRKLADADVRDDLVRADGTGRIELVLYDGDRVEDLT